MEKKFLYLITELKFTIFLILFNIFRSNLHALHVFGQYLLICGHVAQ